MHNSGPLSLSYLGGNGPSVGPGHVRARQIGIPVAEAGHDAERCLDRMVNIVTTKSVLSVDSVRMRAKNSEKDTKNR